MRRAQFWFNLCQPIIRAFKLLAFRSFELLYSTSLDFELQLQWKLLDLFIWANSSVLLSLPKVCLGKLFPSFNFWLIITTGNIKRLWMYFVGISKTSSHKIIIKWIKLRLRPAVNLKCESEWHSNVDFFSSDSHLGFGIFIHHRAKPPEQKTKIREFFRRSLCSPIET